jgi:N-acyl-D-amino-acid deacylase
MRQEQEGWNNTLREAGGAENVLIASLRNPSLKPLIGKTLAEVAALRGVTAEEAAMDLVAEDESRVGSIYFLMSEDEVRRKVALPFMSFGSDGTAVSAEGIFLKSNLHPRGYGNFARVLARYVRDEKIITLEDAVRRMTAHPAAVLGLRDRGRLEAGFHADVVVFDPETIQDHATYVQPHQYATGVSHVIVNGVEALRDGEPTAARPGRFVRGRGWTGWEDGGCRASPQDWGWR